MLSIERRLQLEISRVEFLVNLTKYQFFEGKTGAVYFCQHKVHPDPNLFLARSHISEVEEEILGAHVGQSFHIDPTNPTSLY